MAGTGVGGTSGALTNSSSTAVTYSGLITLADNATVNASTSTGNIVLSNAGTITGGGYTLTLTGSAIGSSLASIVGTGTGGITKAGTGTWTLSASTYTGVTAINLETLSVSSLANGGSNSNIGAATSDAANLVINGRTLKYTGVDVSTDHLFTIGASGATINSSGSAGALAFSNSGIIVASGTGARTLTLTGTASASIAGAISDDASSNATALTKTGSNTWTLSGINTFTGNTTISAGVLKISSAGQLASGSYAGDISVGSGTTFQFSSTAAQTLSGLLSGSGALTKDTGTSNTLSISGSGNTFSGAITIGAGVLQLSGSGVLASGSYSNTISIATSSEFEHSSSANQLLSGIISGAGVVFKDTSSSSTLTLQAANTYSGGTTVSAGTLQANANSTPTSGTITSGPFGTNTVTVQSGGAVDFNGKTLANNLSLAGTGISSLGALLNSSTTSAVVNGAVSLANNATIGIVSSGAMTINGLITGAHAITVNSGSGQTGTLVLTADNSVTNSGYTGGTTIQAGTVQVSTNSAALGTGGVTLGNTTGTSAALLLISTTGLNVANAITLATNATVGTLTIGTTGSIATATYSGGVTGTNNFTIGNTTSTSLTFSTAAINNVGTITNTGSGAGTTIINYGVGSNVTTVTESSTTFALTISATALTVASGGTTLVNSNASGSALLTVSGGIAGTGNLVLNNNSAIANVITLSTTSVNNTGTITNSGTGSSVAISAAIGASVTGVTQNSSNSMLILSGNNLYTSTTTISAGTLQITSNTGLGTTAGGTIVHAGGILDLQGVTVGAESVTLHGGTIKDTTSSLSGNITLTDNSTVSATNAIDILTLSGVISESGGSFGLTKTGAGTVVLGNSTTNSTYSGGTTVNGGTLKAGYSNQPFGTGAVVETSSGGVVIDLNGKTISNALTLYSAATPSVYALTDSAGGGLQQTGAVTLGSNILLGLATGKTMTINSAITDTNGYTLTINKAGDTGTVIFGGANTYTGATTVNAGTLAVTGSGTLGNTSSLLTISSATLDLQNALTIGSLSMSGTSPAITNTTGTSSLVVNGTSTLAGNITTSGAQTYTGAVTLGAASVLTTGSSAGNILFGSTVSGANTLSITTTGDTTFTGAVGGTALSGLTINTATLTAHAISLATSGALSITNSSTGSIDGIIAGTSVTLTKAGASILTLSGANTYTGNIKYQWIWLTRKCFLCCKYQY